MVKKFMGFNFFLFLHVFSHFLSNFLRPPHRPLVVLTLKIEKKSEFKSTYLMFTDTVGAGVIDDASAEPLIWPGAQDVVPAVFQEGLKSQEQAARQEVPKPPVAVLPFHLPSDELFRTTHVQLSIHAQVLHQLSDPVGFGVGVVLDEVEPVVLVDVVV